jgi:hypothetical protein
MSSAFFGTKHDFKTYRNPKSPEIRVKTSTRTIPGASTGIRRVASGVFARYGFGSANMLFVRVTVSQTVTLLAASRRGMLDDE